MIKNEACILYRSYIVGFIIVIVALFGIFPLVSFADITSNLEGYYTMDDNAELFDVVDSSGNGHDGLAGAHTDTLTASGVIGTSLNFAGSYQVDLYPWEGVLGGTWTVASWFKTTNGSGNALLTMGYPDAGCGKAIQMYIDSGYIQAQGGCGTGVNSEPSAGYIDGEWHHFVIVSDGGEVSLYMDGVYIDTDTVSVFDVTTGSFMRIASDQNGNQKTDYLDDFRIYSRALDSGDVTELYAYTGGFGGDVGGCMDSEAINYNASATYDDGSCYFEEILATTTPLFATTTINCSYFNPVDLDSSTSTVDYAFASSTCISNVPFSDVSLLGDIVFAFGIIITLLMFMVMASVFSVLRYKKQRHEY